MQNRLIILAASALAALSAGSATAYWFLNQPTAINVGSLFRLGQHDLPIGVDAVPQDALMTITVSTDSAQWRQLRSLGTHESQAQLNAFLDQWGDRLLSSNGINYTDDVQPWIGDTVTIALMKPAEIAIPETATTGSKTAGALAGVAADDPIIADAPEEETAENTAAQPSRTDTETVTQVPDLNPELIDFTQEQAAVLFIPVADPVAAQERLKTLVASAPVPSERDYQGIAIQTFQQPNNATFEVAAFDRKMLVLATQAGVIDDVIDTYRGEPSLADMEGYGDSLRPVADPSAFAYLYVNAPVARAVAAANSVQPNQPASLAPWQNMLGLTATATLHSAGVTLDGISWRSPDSEPLQLVNQGDRQLARRLPDSTVLMISGNDLNTQWDLYSRRNDGMTDGLFSPQFLRETTQTRFGLDLETDVMGWMDGHFAFALATSQAEGSSLSSSGFVFMVETSDRPTAEQTLSTLDKGVAAEYQLQVDDHELGGQPVVNWQRPAGSLSLTRGWLDDKVAFFGSDRATKLMVPSPEPSLASTALYQQAMASQPTSNTGTFFLNVEAVMQQRDQLPVPAFFPDQAQLIDAIRAIGLTVSTEGDRQRRYRLSIVTHTTDDVSITSDPADQ
jgi:hypothetical protein